MFGDIARQRCVARQLADGMRQFVLGASLRPANRTRSMQL
jgi:hypothetical protein